MQFLWRSFLLEDLQSSRVSFTQYCSTQPYFVDWMSFFKIKLSEWSSRVSHKSTFFKIRNEYPWNLFLLGHWYWKYKFFHSNPLFSSSTGFLTVLHLPSGVENFFIDNPSLSYIKNCVLACRLQIWTSFLVLPRQNIE